MSIRINREVIAAAISDLAQRSEEATYQGPRNVSDQDVQVVLPLLEVSARSRLDAFVSTGGQTLTSNSDFHPFIEQDNETEPFITSGDKLRGGLQILVRLIGIHLRNDDTVTRTLIPVVRRKRRVEKKDGSGFTSTQEIVRGRPMELGAGERQQAYYLSDLCTGLRFSSPTTPPDPENVSEDVMLGLTFEGPTGPTLGIVNGLYDVSPINESLPL